MLVIGVGNRYRSDDRAGLEVATRLQDHGALNVRQSEGEPIGLIEVWDGASVAIVIDAVSSGAPAGTIHRLDASTQPLPANIGGAPSTHAVGLGEAIELGRTLGRLPGSLLVYGIEGEHFGAGEELSPAVAAAIDSTVESVLRDATDLAQQSPRA